MTLFLMYRWLNSSVEGIGQTPWCITATLWNQGAMYLNTG